MKISTDGLESQVSEARRTIASDGYPISIGEITSLYRDGELIIRPEFQRLFRWTLLQKSRLVESILLGIPLPSIFVSQRDDGKWELVDGLQRVSTILQLQNELLTDAGEKYEPLVLEGTKYLSELEGRSWDSREIGKSFSQVLKLDVKRSKLDVKILKRESSKETKFDLFQRLNNFGSTLTPQEVRSALLVGASPDFFAWLQKLASYESFTNTVSIPETSLDERFDFELVLRFLILHARDESLITVSTLKNFSTVLDDESMELAKNFPKNSERLANTFRRTFDIINANGGDAIFSRWDSDRSEFRGPFLNTSFEVFALGLGFHVSAGTPHRTDLIKVAKKLWRRPDMSKGFATGKSTETRLTKFIPLGRKLLAG